MSYLTIYELAKMWRISSKTITAWVRVGKIPATKFGHQYRILQSDADKLVAEWKTIKEAVLFTKADWELWLYMKYQETT